MTIIRHVFDFGKIAYGNPKQRANRATVELEVRSTDRGLELSICGTIWNRPETDCLSGGQNLDDMAHYLRGVQDFRRLHTLWKSHHLNGMQAGCEHQRALGWRSYDEHPSEPCPTCGYKYGSAWLMEPLPEAVLLEIESLTGETIPRAATVEG